MASPNPREIGLPSVQALESSSNLSLQPASTPYYVISPQEIAADRDSPLRTTKRTGTVFKGFWNNSIVAVKILSNDSPVDVRNISFTNFEC
jgi:hypothetical protein